jgi:RNA polymerase sigma factor (sigma-70 family)
MLWMQNDAVAVAGWNRPGRATILARWDAVGGRWPGPGTGPSPMDSTCWTTLRDAAAGARPAREEFASRYVPMVRAYLAARWRSSPMIQELEDAVQEVFVECLRQGGALQHARDDRPGGFRPFLYGLARNVALRFERTRARRLGRESAGGPGPDRIEDDETSLSRAFDRAWAQALMREAAAHQERLAADRGAAARRRVELLRLRFRDGLPIREIARLWGDDPAALHHEYARARAEFREALLDRLAYEHPAPRAELERECRELLDLLG